MLFRVYNFITSNLEIQMQKTCYFLKICVNKKTKSKYSFISQKFPPDLMTLSFGKLQIEYRFVIVIMLFNNANL